MGTGSILGTRGTVVESCREWRSGGAGGGAGKRPWVFTQAAMETSLGHFWNLAVADHDPPGTILAI